MGADVSFITEKAPKISHSAVEEALGDRTDHESSIAVLEMLRNHITVSPQPFGAYGSSVGRKPTA